MIIIVIVIIVAQTLGVKRAWKKLLRSDTSADSVGLLVRPLSPSTPRYDLHFFFFGIIAAFVFEDFRCFLFL